MAAHVAAERHLFDCATCTWGRHCDESNPAPFEKFVIRIEGRPFLKSRTCLLPMITADSRRWTRLHWHYKNNILATAGGWDDQYELYKQAMEVLDQTLNQIDLERAKNRPGAR